MKILNLKNRVAKLALWAMGISMVFGVTSCKDDSQDTTTIPFDPNQPVVITSFTPDKVGSYDQMIIYGKNFGTDKENVSLTLGGKKAVVINVMSDKLYAMVPSLALSGEISLTVSDGQGHSVTGVSPVNFTYDVQTVVGTLCGYQNDNDTQGELWGSFDICAGFNYEGCMAIDPLYPDKVYIAYDGGNKIVELDMTARTCTLLIAANVFQNRRLRNIDFTLDGQYMLVSTDRDDLGFTSPSVWIVSRNPNGTFSNTSSAQVIASYKQCNGVAVHPVNGEVYFNSYSNGELFRMELEDYFATLIPDEETGELPERWTGLLEDKCFRELFKIQDPSYEFQVTIHPSGDYAYITVINRNYILRTDYNWTKKEFMTPYVVAGSNGEGNWIDAVGTNARVNRPYQGVFVKNPQYEAEGKSDIYDFYFADCLNFCVRYITPEGIVRTYAGRAPSTNGNIWGTEDGALRSAARFRDVTGLVYDEVRERFYVLDHNNRRIRTIGKESDDLIMNGPDEDDEPADDDTEQIESPETE